MAEIENEIEEKMFVIVNYEGEEYPGQVIQVLSTDSYRVWSKVVELVQHGNGQIRKTRKLIPDQIF